MSVALEALRAGALRGMREDCAPDDGRARESLLQFYRDSHKANRHFRLSAQPARDDPYNEEDLAALEWLAALAASGHAGAASLLKRVFSVAYLAGGSPRLAGAVLAQLEAWLGGIYRAFRQRVVAFSVRAPDLAGVLAFIELAREPPDPPALLRALEGVKWDPWLAEVVRLAGSAPSEAERKLLRDVLAASVTDDIVFYEKVLVGAGELAALLALPRLASQSPEVRTTGERLMAYAEANGANSKLLAGCRDQAAKVKG